MIGGSKPVVPCVLVMRSRIRAQTAAGCPVLLGAAGARRRHVRVPTARPGGPCDARRARRDGNPQRRIPCRKVRPTRVLTSRPHRRRRARAWAADQPGAPAPGGRMDAAMRASGHGWPVARTRRPRPRAGDPAGVFRREPSDRAIVDAAIRRTARDRSPKTVVGRRRPGHAFFGSFLFVQKKGTRRRKPAKPNPRIQSENDPTRPQEPTGKWCPYRHPGGIGPEVRPTARHGQEQSGPMPGQATAANRSDGYRPGRGPGTVRPDGALSASGR